MHWHNCEVFCSYEVGRFFSHFVCHAWWWAAKWCFSSVSHTSQWSRDGHFGQFCRSGRWQWGGKDESLEVGAGESRGGERVSSVCLVYFFNFNHSGWYFFLFLFFLSDPGVLGVRSMGPDVCLWLIELVSEPIVETYLMWVWFIKIPTQYQLIMQIGHSKAMLYNSNWLLTLEPMLESSSNDQNLNWFATN